MTESSTGQDVDLLAAGALIFTAGTDVERPDRRFLLTDDLGREVGAVRMVGESGVREIAHLFTDVSGEVVRLRVEDAAGEPVLQLERDDAYYTAGLVVRGPDGDERGRLQQRNITGDTRLELLVGDRTVGSVVADDWHADDFDILSDDGWLGRLHRRAADDGRVSYRLELRQEPASSHLRPLLLATVPAVHAAIERERRR